MNNLNHRPGIVLAQGPGDPKQPDFPRPERPTTVPHVPTIQPVPGSPIPRPHDPPTGPPHETPTRPQPGSVVHGIH